MWLINVGNGVEWSIIGTLLLMLLPWGLAVYMLISIMTFFLENHLLKPLCIKYYAR